MGIGTVELEMARVPGQNGLEPNAELTLKHVLHVPSAPCNIIGFPKDFLDEYTVQMSFNGASNGMIKSLDGHTIAYFDSSQINAR